MHMDSGGTDLRGYDHVILRSLIARGMGTKLEVDNIRLFYTSRNIRKLKRTL